MKSLLPVLLCAVCLFASLAVAQVIPPNLNPRFTEGADVAVDEDSGIYSVLWATQMSDGEGLGGAHSRTQSLSFVVVASQPQLFSSGPTIDSGGILHFTPAPDATGSTPVTVYLQDDGTAQCVVGGNVAACPSGCSPTDCSKSATVTFQINIRPKNDCPTFLHRGDQTVDEDSGQVTSVGFAYQVSKGASNEATQTLTFDVSVGAITPNTLTAPTMFTQMPAISWNPANPSSADLTYTPAADACGQASVSVTLRDDGGIANGGCDRTPTATTFMININCINDRPTFTAGASPVTVLEDSGTATFAQWATLGPAEPHRNPPEVFNFNLQFVDPTSASLFSVLPSIDPNTGTLTFTPAPNANTFGRTVQMYVQLQDNSGGTPNDLSCNPITACPRVTIVITPVNDAGRFVPGGDIVVYEDLCNMPVPPVPPIWNEGVAWASNIDVGAINEGIGVGQEGQIAVFDVVNDNQGLFDRQPGIDARGTLTFQLKPDAAGIATVGVTMHDTGLPAVPTAQRQSVTFTITVRPVNDPPTFVIRHPNPIVVNENSGAHTISVWANNIYVGPLNEQLGEAGANGNSGNTAAPGNNGAAAGHTMQNIINGGGFFFEPEDPSFFSTQPTSSISTDGTAELQFAVAPNRWGTTRVRVVLQDDGGVQPPGTTCSADSSEQTLTIIVNSVNDPPQFMIATPEVVVVENEYPLGFTRTGYLYNITAGIGEDGPMSSVLQGQSVRFVLTHGFNSLFSTQPAVDEQGKLTFTTAQDQYGEVDVTIYAEDNQVPPAVSASQTFTIRILPRNNPPSYDIAGDLLGRKVTECKSVDTCTKVFANYATNVFPGPINERATQSVTISVTYEPQFNFLFAATGAPRIEPLTGVLVFTLAESAHTAVGNPVTMTITATDNGGTSNGGIDRTVKTFQLEVQALDDPPTFTAGADQSVAEDSARQLIPAWATTIMRGPGDDSTTDLAFNLAVEKPELFADQPQISFDVGLSANGRTGTLSYTPAANRFGTTLVQVALVNTLTGKASEQFTFNIEITAVNDMPSFTPGSDLRLAEGTGYHRFPWATNIHPGPYEDRQILSFAVVCTGGNFFTIAPTIDPADGYMKMTLAPGMHGLADCRVELSDNGPSDATNVNKVDKPFSLTITAVNDAPTFIKGDDITIQAETDQEQLINNFITNIDAGAGESQQQVVFFMTPDRTDAFDVNPRIDVATGTLSFTLKKYFNGVIKVSYYAQDNGPNTGNNNARSVTETVQIVVKPVNDAPLFEPGNNVAVLENSGTYRLAHWATQIAAGPPNEIGQSLKFECTATNPNLFGLPPVVDSVSGDLMFSTAVDIDGITTVNVCLIDNGGTDNNGVDRVCKTMSISIASVNKAPTAIFADVVTVLEDAGLIRIANFLTAVAAGPSADETNQQIRSIRVTVPSQQQSMFSVAPTIDLSSKELSFQPAADMFGDVTVTVTVQDNGGSANGGTDTMSGTFTIRVLAVNDRPTFTAGLSLNLREDAPHYNALWATSIRPGPTNENDQTVMFVVTPSIPSMFAVAPSMNAAGFLDFRLKANVNGAVDLVVQLKDNGGIENGGIDTSLPATVSITVEAINDAPVFTAGPEVILREDAGPFIYRSWATNIAGGPEEEAALQTVTFELTPVDATFFQVPPTIDVLSGDLTFTLAPNKFGTTSVTVVLRDNGVNGINGAVSASSPRVLTIRVTAVNDAPTFVTAGDVTVLEDAGDQVVKSWITSKSAGQHETTQNVFFTLTAADPVKFAKLPRIIGNDLTFTTAQDVNGALVVTVNASDRSGNADGGVSFSSQTFSIIVTPVNDAPSFTVGNDVTASEGTTLRTFPGWIPRVVPGPVDEEDQILTSHMTLDRADILESRPLIDISTRTLSFRAKPFAFGTVEILLYFIDNGGTANGGIDTSASQSFKITIAPLNNKPSFNSGSLVIIASNQAALYSAPWASNISSGPLEPSQAVGFVVTPADTSYFTVNGQPRISSTGILSFTVTPGIYGNTTLEVRAQDASGARSDPVYVTVIIGSAYSLDTISVTLDRPATTFSADDFKRQISTNLGVPVDRIAIRQTVATPEGLRVDFQILSADNPVKIDEALTRILVDRLLQANHPLRLALQVRGASMVSSQAGNVAPVQTPQPATATAAADSGGVNRVALIIGLFMGLAFIAIIIALVVAYRRHKEKKKVARAEAYAAATGMSPHGRAVDVHESPAVWHNRTTADLPNNPIQPTFMAKEPSPGRGPASSPAWANWDKVRKGIATPSKKNPPPTLTAHERQPDYQHGW